MPINSKNKNKHFKSKGYGLQKSENLIAFYCGFFAIYRADKRYKLLVKLSSDAEKLTPEERLALIEKLRLEIGSNNG
jgi:hypothetical protein